ASTGGQRVALLLEPLEPSPPALVAALGVAQAAAQLIERLPQRLQRQRPVVGRRVVSLADLQTDLRRQAGRPPLVAIHGVAKPFPFHAGRQESAVQSP